MASSLPSRATLSPAPHVRRSRAAVPPGHRRDIASVLIPETRIQRRVQELAAAISADYRGQELVMVALLNGTVAFLADLMRRMEFPLTLDLMGVSSYRSGTTPGELTYTKRLKLDVRGRHVLVIDDILDTGKTLTAVTRELSSLGAATLRTCVLLDKPTSRPSGGFEADYVGFVVPHLFVVGYGLDYAEKYRNLPFVGVLKREVYASEASH
jgi:hypoxanthine phosphoribosyltransferase